MKSSESWESGVSDYAALSPEYVLSSALIITVGSDFLQRLAIQTIQLLMNMMASASRSVKIALAHSVFDIFLVHEAAILKNQDNNVSSTMPSKNRR